MSELVRGGDSVQLSKDINIVTAEIKSYQQIAGQAIFEIGRRLKHVKENDLVHGEWSSWCESIGMSRNYANRFVKVYEELGNSNGVMGHQIGFKALYEIATMPEEERTKSHTVPSSGEKKRVDEMTVRELREVKNALKAEQEVRVQAEQQVNILRDTIASIEDRTTRTEVRTEYIEVPDRETAEKIRRYEEIFGDVSIYEGKTTRVSNGDAITYTVFEFSEDVRKFIEKYGHLTHFAREFNEMISEGKQEYTDSINSMFKFLQSIQRNINEKETIIIEQ